MHQFKAQLELIGINPYVLVPNEILNDIFKQSGREKGPIPIKGSINNQPYIQTLVKYSGAWRLYINTTMLPKSPQRIGEIIDVTLAFDPEDRSIQPHPKLIRALNENKDAKKIFDTLPPSRQKEIIRYIATLKNEEIRDKNIAKAINFLNGKEKFIGREKP